MKRLLWIAGATLLVAGLLAVLPRSGSDPAALESGVESLPVFPAEVELGDAGMIPYRLRVPKDHEIHLLVRAAPRAGEGLLGLSGYENLVDPVYIGPGQSRELVFTSTRPGDDFAITLDGAVLGRLEVTGNHLEEGHQ